MYLNRKNVWPLQEARALVIDMCAGQLERPNIPVTTIVLEVFIDTLDLCIIMTL